LKFSRITFAAQIQQIYDKKTQLSQRGRAMLRVIEYFAKSLKVTQGHSKWHRLIDRIRVLTGVPSGGSRGGGPGGPGPPPP